MEMLSMLRQVNESSGVAPGWPSRRSLCLCPGLPALLAVGVSQWTLCVRLTSVQGSLSIVHAHLVHKNRYSLKSVLLQKPLKIGAWRARPTLIRDTTPSIACSMVLVPMMMTSSSLLLLPTHGPLRRQSLGE